MKTLPKTLALSLTATALLSACAVGPDYRRPELHIPDQFKEAPAGWQAAQPADAAPRGQWWTAYGDPVLNDLVAQVEVSNQNLLAAAANYRQARAQVQESRAAFFPTLSASGKVSRGGSGAGGNAAANGGAGGGGGVATNRSISLDAAWEPDLWGAVRRTVEASDARSQASAAQLANVRLSMQAELVQDYLSLRITERQSKLADDTVAGYTRTAQITRNQLGVGIVTKSDVAQADAQLKSAEAQRIDYELTRRQYEHAIAILIGKAPADFTLPAAAQQPVLPVVPGLLPSSLLERRPDIANAERNAAAANAQIGVARAAWFPALNLSASVGSTASAASQLFSSSARVWSLGAGLAETIFDGGARSARVDEALAGYDAAAAQYRQTVLGGLQEVEDNLAAAHLLSDEADRQDEAVRASAEAERLALSQYKAGTADFTTVAASQAAHHSAEISALSILGRRYNASVLLIKALGGGWDGNLTPNGKVAAGE